MFIEKAGFPFGVKPISGKDTRVIFVNRYPKAFGMPDDLSDTYFQKFNDRGPPANTLKNEPGTVSYVFGKLMNSSGDDIRNGMVSIVEAYTNEDAFNTHVTNVLGGPTPELTASFRASWKVSDVGYLFKPQTEQRKLGTQGLICGAQGFGAMGLTAFYGKPSSDDHCIGIIQSCISHGINMFDTAEAYAVPIGKNGGILYNESVLGKAIAAVGHREKFIIATKHSRIRPGLNKEELHKAIRKSCEKSLQRLGIKTIDLYYLHRMYPDQEIEDVMEGFKKLVQDGLIKYVGLSEAPPSYIRRAHVVTPISAVQQEWSLIARDLEEPGGVVDTCRELGIGIVPYSPVARGFLSGQFNSGDLPTSFKATIPYLKKENLKNNVTVAKRIESMAANKGLTLSQLSLAWVMNQGVDVVPIPGTTSFNHLEENVIAAHVKLTGAEMAEIANAASSIKGDRGDERYMSSTFRAKM
jgi:aryl-alcohol dehydrogenase-like predicted oxidoreductase